MPSIHLPCPCVLGSLRTMIGRISRPGGKPRARRKRYRSAPRVSPPAARLRCRMAWNISAPRARAPRGSAWRPCNRNNTASVARTQRNGGCVAIDIVLFMSISTAFRGRVVHYVLLNIWLGVLCAPRRLCSGIRGAERYERAVPRTHIPAPCALTPVLVFIPGQVFIPSLLRTRSGVVLCTPLNGGNSDSPPFPCPFSFGRTGAGLDGTRVRALCPWKRASAGYCPVL